MEKSSWIQAMDGRTLDGPLVVSFASWSYRRVCENWVHAIERIGCRNYLIGALDERMFEHLRLLKVPTWRVDIPPLPPWKKLFRNGWPGRLWLRRMEVLKEMIDGGWDVLHSDLDAVWREDPRGTLFSDQRWDVIASQGTTYPPAFHDRFGFVICMGLIQFRARPAVKAWMDSLVERLRSSPRPDDQWEANLSLLEGRSFRVGNLHWLEHGDLQIRVLDPADVSRGPHGRYVAHPLSAKEGVAKEQVLQDARLWVRG